MKTRMLLWGLAVAMTVGLAVGCDEDSKPCVTCPGPQPDPVMTAAAQYIDSHQAELGIRDGLDDVRPYRVVEDELGFFHIRYYQYYREIRVQYGTLILHLTPQYYVSRVTNSLARGIDANTRPIATCEQARFVAERHFEEAGYSGRQSEPSELVILRRQSGDALCWRLVLEDSRGVEIRQYFVDARSSEIVYWHSLIIVG